LFFTDPFHVCLQGSTTTAVRQMSCCCRSSCSACSMVQHTTTTCPSQEAALQLFLAALPSAQSRGQQLLLQARPQQQSGALSCTGASAGMTLQVPATTVEPSAARSGERDPRASQCCATPVAFASCATGPSLK
jgi:hypothetical protein